MERKKKYIISIIIVAIIALSFGGYYFYKNIPNTPSTLNKPLTEKERIDIIDQLSKESTNNFSDKQMNDIINNLGGAATKLTEEQKIDMIKSAGQ